MASRRRVAREGDVVAVRLTGGEVAYVQRIVKSGHGGWLVRALLGKFTELLPEGEVQALVGGATRFVALVSLLEEDSEFVLNAEVPAGERFDRPVRVFRAASDENPDGWTLAFPDGTAMSGAEFTAKFPEVDQWELPGTRVSRVPRLVKKLEFGRDPSNDRHIGYQRPAVQTPWSEGHVVVVGFADARAAADARAELERNRFPMVVTDNGDASITGFPWNLIIRGPNGVADDAVIDHVAKKWCGSRAGSGTEFAAQVMRSGK